MWFFIPWWGWIFNEKFHANCTSIYISIQWLSRIPLLDANPKGKDWKQLKIWELWDSAAYKTGVQGKILKVVFVLTVETNRIPTECALYSYTQQLMCSWTSATFLIRSCIFPLTKPKGRTSVGGKGLCIIFSYLICFSKPIFLFLIKTNWNIWKHLFAACMLPTLH